MPEIPIVRKKRKPVSGDDDYYTVPLTSNQKLIWEHFKGRDKVSINDITVWCMTNLRKIKGEKGAPYKPGSFSPTLSDMRAKGYAYWSSNNLWGFPLIQMVPPQDDRYNRDTRQKKSS
jgi:hypothetical protein